MKPPSVATLKTWDVLHAERGTRAAAASAYQRKRGRKAALGLCATVGCKRKRDGRVYCTPCLNRLSRERERSLARGGQTPTVSKQIDADPHTSTAVLLPGTIVPCPVVGCRWTGARREMWRHNREHRK